MPKINLLFKRNFTYFVVSFLESIRTLFAIVEGNTRRAVSLLLRYIFQHFNSEWAIEAGVRELLCVGMEVRDGGAGKGGIGAQARHRPMEEALVRKVGDDSLAYMAHLKPTPMT